MEIIPTPRNYPSCSSTESRIQVSFASLKEISRLVGHFTGEVHWVNYIHGLSIEQLIPTHPKECEIVGQLGSCTTDPQGGGLVGQLYMLVPIFKFSLGGIISGGKFIPGRINLINS